MSAAPVTSPSGMLHYRPEKQASLDNIYADRDPEAQGAHFMRHLDRMTIEGLHAKSAIAAELAHRDCDIDRLKALNAELAAALEFIEGLYSYEARAGENASALYEACCMARAALAKHTGETK